MIVVDWGTSSLRAYRLDGDGVVVARREGPHGILAVPAGGFSEVLRHEIADWLREEPGEIWLSGMIGSRQGWHEAPYVACPAGPAEIAGAVVRLTWEEHTLAFVPGLLCRDAAGAPDVMRGEEVQVVGILPALEGTATVVLPGTHSKWVAVVAGRIAGFRTHMTGEAFALFRRHSILGRLIPDDAPASDRDGFAAGLARAGSGAGLLADLFAVRTTALLDEMPPERRAGFLSGILIGHEVAAALAAAPAGPVHVVAAPALAAAYVEAIGRHGRAAVAHPADAAAAGLFRLARAAPHRPR